MSHTTPKAPRSRAWSSVSPPSTSPASTGSRAQPRRSATREMGYAAGNSLFWRLTDPPQQQHAGHPGGCGQRGQGLCTASENEKGGQCLSTIPRKISRSPSPKPCPICRLRLEPQSTFRFSKTSVRPSTEVTNSCCACPITWLHAALYVALPIIPVLIHMRLGI